MDHGQQKFLLVVKVQIFKLLSLDMTCMFVILQRLVDSHNPVKKLRSPSSSMRLHV